MVELERPKTRRLTRVPLIAAGALPGLCLLIGGCNEGTPRQSAAEARVVNVYSWSNYIAPEVVANFERETGIRVQLDFFDGVELLETKLLTGRSGYDVVVLGGDALRVVAAGAVQPLDREKLPNWRHLDSALMEQVERHDPENRYLAGYTWGTTGLAFDAALVRAAAPDAPLDSWSLVLDPRHAKRLAGCGISVLDARSEILSLTLAYLGRDPGGDDPADLAAAEKALLAVRPYIRKFDVDGQIGDLASGEICAMIAPSANLRLARGQAAEAGRVTELRFVIPVEGTTSWFDTLAIPVDAPHPGEAHAFIDYMLKPESAVATSDYLGIATLNASAAELVDASIRNDPSIYPPEDVLARLTPIVPDDQAQSRVETRIWTRIKTGT